MSAAAKPAAPPMAGTAKPEIGAWSPLAISTFRWVWIATVVSNIGTWFQEVTAGWLMTELGSSALMVSLVQAANTLPVLLFGLPAGAFADILDRRRLLIGMTFWMTAMAALMAFLQWQGVLGPWGLLALIFAVAMGTALTAPAWQAIVPELVPRSHLSPAIALNSVGINISRAIGPALAGLVLSLAGPAAAFAINAVSFLGVVAVLIWWKRPGRADNKLPSEHFVGAMAVGLRYVRYAPAFRAVMVRSFSFAFSAVALWALLPLVTRDLLQRDATGYGILLAVIGAGAVTGAVLLPPFRKRLGPEGLTLVATLLYAGVLAAIATAPPFYVVVLLMLPAGLCWIAMLSTLHVSAQILLPPWVRARGLSLSLTVFFGSMAVGSSVWGLVAGEVGLPNTLLAAAATLVVLMFTRVAYKLPHGEMPVLTPSRHWPEPDLAFDDAEDRGPVLILVEYQVAEANTEPFLREIAALERIRRRDGALSWSIYEDPDRPGTWVEAFVNRSWLEHLRQHDRVTEADREVESRVRAFHEGADPVAVKHLIAPNMPAPVGKRESK